MADGDSRGGAETRRGQQKHFWAGRRPPDAPCLLLFLPPCLSRLSVRHSCLRSDGLNSLREGAIQSQTNRQACLPVRMDQKRQLGFPSSAQSSAVNPVNFVNPVILSKAYCSSRLGGSAEGYIWVMQDDDLPMRFTFETNVLPYFVT